jgi:iron complex outermembrane receptor protein
MKKSYTFFCSFLLLLSSVVAASPTVFAAEGENEKTENVFPLEEVVVTAPAVTETLTVDTDPKAPRQPVPAADGGGYLKNIPGFSVTRQGGTGSDPLFRGLGGTRLNVLLDGAYQLGGCPYRMDPTTSYVFPEAYDKITVLKGPESILYGGGNVAGTVLFERSTPRFTEPGVRVNSSVLVGSSNRNDEFLDVTAGDTQGYVRIIRSRSDSDDYTDGAGNKVHSFYTRNNLTGIVGWTPNANTLFEFSADSSNAQAAYAGRSMDGSKFDRTAYNFKFEKTNISPLLQKLEFSAYHSTVDHVMDNYTLRTPSSMGGMMGMPSEMAMAVGRTTNGGRLAAKLSVSPNTLATVGVDYQKTEHTNESDPDMTFSNYGIFSDFNHKLDNNNRLLGGLRLDKLDVTDYTNSGKTDSDTTHGAFLRYEHDYAKAPITSYVGIGHAERPADYWERQKTGWESLTPEKNTQLDTGLLYQSGKLKTNLSLFYSKIDDFILWTNNGSNVSNINATLYGGEVDLSYALAKHWTATASLASVHGNNDTSDKPLAQTPPLEGTLGVKYENEKLNAGLLWRGVTAQNRYDVGSGSEIGQDIGRTGGFGILSANISYRATKNVLITAGVDNIFNKNYAEFLSRTGVEIDGFPASTRVNEPGRTIWLKTSYSF